MRSGSSNTWASPDSRIYIDLDNTLVINPMNKYVFPVVYREMSDHLGLEPDYVRRLLIKKHLEYIVKNPLLAYDWDFLMKCVVRDLGYPKNVNLLELHLENCHKAEVLDNAVEILEELASSGYHIVIATNGLWKYQRCIVEHTGLKHVVDAVLTPDATGCLKNSSNYYYLLRPAKLMLSVGDN
ncbi:MAG: hypothetical protein DRO12_03425, partial [Thermoprotei archaeon]